MFEKKDRILDVKNLRISFKTNTGTVKAVRGINFSLYKGRTLAIVGESGSGKSVTSKAILGILANNKIIEDGRIIYDGKDLLTLPENKFTKIRGVKISMIFQDPLSALNPIMKVGKQLTEAMYLESKSLKKEANKYINRINKTLKKYINKEDMKSLYIACKNNVDESELKKELKANFFAGFKKCCTQETQYFLENLNKSKELIEKFYSEIASKSFKEVDFKVFKAQQKEIKKALSVTKDFISTSPDDVLDVYSYLMKSYVKSIRNSTKLQNRLAKILAKYHVDNVFDLPAKVRTKEREVITSEETYFDSIDNINRAILKHIRSINEKYETISDKIVESFINTYAHMIVQMNSTLTKADTKAKAIELMKEVGIPEPERRFYQYPFEFSGGMRQRIVIAIALSGNPEILICDEPTTALDVTIQAQILELIQRLKVEKNLSIIFITHDLGVVANMADDIAVMYAGKIVEYGTVYDIFYDPRHPYTWALLSSMPDLNTQGRLEAIPGTPPNMLLPPKGDAFAARNSYAIALDYKQEPPFFEVSDTHSVKTWLAHKDSIDVVPPQTVIERIKNSLKENPKNKPTYTLKKNSVLEIIKKGGKK